MLYCWVVFFFFQAEDGIRDLVRSRGLGDVYKRQGLAWSCVASRSSQLRASELAARPVWRHISAICLCRWYDRTAASVSYTHLTLPTSDLV